MSDFWGLWGLDIHEAGTYYHRSVTPRGDGSDRAMPHSYFYTGDDPHGADWETRAYGDHVYQTELDDSLMEPDPAPRRNPQGNPWFRTDPSNVGELTHIHDPDAPFGTPRTGMAAYDDYAGLHKSPGPNGSGWPVHEMTNVADEDLGGVPEDWYTHPHYYSSGASDGGSAKDMKATQKLYNDMRGKPDHPVTVYRALPHGNTDFNTGDWVTPSLNYAKGHAMQSDNPAEDWPVIKTTVPAKHLYQNGDSYDEFGYHGPSHPGTVHGARTATGVLPPPHKDSWNPGEQAHYEYHCLQDESSSDYHLWQRSHQPVKVLGLSPDAEDWSPDIPTLNERADEGTPNVYRVKFQDGHEDDAWEDELLTHPGHFSPRHNPPPTKIARRTMTAAVTLFTKPNCPQCTMTKNQLDKHGIEHDVVDLSADDSAYDYVTGELGYKQAPVVHAGDDNHWSGFRPDRIKALIGG